MKKRMRFAAMLTSALMLCNTGTTTYAVEELYYFGAADQMDFRQMETINDREMLRYVVTGEGYGNNSTPYYVCTRHIDKTNRNQLYVVVPRESHLRFVLKDGLDTTDAEKQMFTILDDVYPGISEKRILKQDEKVWVQLYQTSDGYYDLFVNSLQFLTEEAKTTGKADVSNYIMKALNDAGLISAFYTWGETAYYHEIFYNYNNVTLYIPSENTPFDWDAVAAWVQEHHPECRFVSVTAEDTELAKEIGFYNYETEQTLHYELANISCVYAIIPPEGMTFADQFELAGEVFEQFGLRAGYHVPEIEYRLLIGQNSLAIAGDANFDCAVDVADAVLVARFAAEDKEAVITDQGKENADVTHDGNVDGQDAEKILQYIAKKIDYKNLTAENYDFTAAYVRTNSYTGAYPREPHVRQFTTRDELDAFITENEEALQAPVIGSKISFADATSNYSKEWFDEHKLLVVCVLEYIGTVYHEVTDVSKNAIKINRIHTSNGTADMAYWHILIELDKSATISDDISVSTTVVD